jgi:hypothetical protein
MICSNIHAMQLFSKTIASSKDFFQFEKEIRTLLGCDSTYCAFFQSADYIHLKLLIRSQLRQKPAISKPFVLYIPKTSYSIQLQDDYQTLLVFDNLQTLDDESTCEESSCERDVKRPKIERHDTHLFDKFTNKLFLSRGE